MCTGSSIRVRLHSSTAHAARPIRASEGERQNFTKNLTYSRDYRALYRPFFLFNFAKKLSLKSLISLEESRGFSSSGKLKRPRFSHLQGCCPRSAERFSLRRVLSCVKETNTLERSQSIGFFGREFILSFFFVELKFFLFYSV